MCLPAVEEFVVTNTATSGPLIIYSCSTDSSSFQPSFFHRQVLLRPVSLFEPLGAWQAEGI